MENYDYDGVIEDAMAQQQRDMLAMQEQYEREMQEQYEQEMLRNRISEKLYGAPEFIIDEFIPEEILPECYSKIDAIASRYNRLYNK